MTTIETKLKELEKLDKAATPGPWVVDQPYGSTMKTVNTSIEMDDGTVIPIMDWVIGHMQVSNCPRFREDAKLIATYRNEMPNLIAALREAVASLGGYATLPKGAYAGPDDLYHDLGDSASVTLTNINKILNGGK